MEDAMFAITWLGFFACVFFGWYYYLQARNKERMALIEKNADIAEIYKKREIRFHFPWLKLGMIITGAGLGLFAAVLFSLFPGGDDLIRKSDGALYFSLIFLFGGAGVVIAYFVERPKNR